MSQVLMMLILPIGLYVFFVVEKKSNKEYQAVFDNFQKKISADSTLSSNEKIDYFKKMLVQNGYTIKTTTNTTVYAEKKILSLGLMMIGIGTYFIGLFIYLFYYFYIQKPHKVTFTI